jgi:hypothetical protein
MSQLTRQPILLWALPLCLAAVYLVWRNAPDNLAGVQAVTANADPGAFDLVAAAQESLAGQESPKTSRVEPSPPAQLHSAEEAATEDEWVAGAISQAMLMGAPESVQTAAYRLPDLYETFKEYVEGGKQVASGESHILLLSSIAVLEYAAGRPPTTPRPDEAWRPASGEDGTLDFMFNGDLFTIDITLYPDFAVHAREYSAGFQNPGSGTYYDVARVAGVLSRAEEALEWLSQ